MLNCVEISNKNPDKLNEEGKKDLGFSIIEEMGIEGLNKFLEKNGYETN